MSFVDNLKKKMNGEDDLYDENYADDGYYSENFGSYEDPVDSEPAAQSGAPYGASGISLSGASGNALEMKVVKPESFDTVAQIADHLLSRRTVVLNLENTSKETARRLIDFLSGVAYSIDGSLKKIASNAYVITPSNVDVGDAKLTARKPAPAPKAEPAIIADEDFGDY